MIPIEMTGRVFGYLTVLKFAGSHKRKRRYLCACSCGNETTAAGSDLRYGRSTSCGCKRLAILKERNAQYRAVRDGLGRFIEAVH